MLIKEVILENFMSYEYARVPLKEGVNVVCGPNGSGKSSLLLGICVALGDTYTERSKRLSDLIRWGSDTARVTLIIDNQPRENGLRPLPQYDLDEITLTRTLRKDGKYGFQVNHRNVSKAEVVQILRAYGFDPDNMLIIMHQAMPTKFANISPRERLRILEEAVGIESFRRDLVESREKLKGILSEEESLQGLLSQARETLNYWREQYEKLQERRSLQTRQAFLQQELAWSRVQTLEENLERGRRALQATHEEIAQAEEETGRALAEIRDAEARLRNLNQLREEIVERRVEAERLAGISEHNLEEARRRIALLEESILETIQQRRRFETTYRNLLNQLQLGRVKLDDYFNLFQEMEETQLENYENLNARLKQQREELEAQLAHYEESLRMAEEEVSKLVNQSQELAHQWSQTNNQYIEARIHLALLKDRRSRLERKLRALQGEESQAQADLDDAIAEAELRGPRVETGRSSEEVLNEIRRTQGLLMALANVPEEAREMYENYNQTFQEIQQRIHEVRENRKRMLLEIEERARRWREVIENLLEEVNQRYKELLRRLQATGEVRLINSHDIDSAGLEIYVGFKGAPPTVLDPYTHSGGERSSGVMAFLLALQQNVLSPFRAVDEFDLHMDPQNKEVVSEFIVSAMDGSRGQYMAITPSQVTFKGKDVHIIMVHKTDATSQPRIVED